MKLALKLYSRIETSEDRILKMPEGCLGVCFVFEDEESGKKFIGDDTEFADLEEEEEFSEDVELEVE